MIKRIWCKFWVFSGFIYAAQVLRVLLVTLRGHWGRPSPAQYCGGFADYPTVNLQKKPNGKFGLKQLV